MKESGRAIIVFDLIVLLKRWVGVFPKTFSDVVFSDAFDFDLRFYWDVGGIGRTP